jgi:hypothetical protein
MRDPVLALGVAGLALLPGPRSSAHATPLPPLTPTVRLSSAPRSGARVSGVVHVRGRADAPEGVVRVALYVLDTDETAPSGYDVPAAASERSVPLGPADFDLSWDTSVETRHAVNLVVVADTVVRHGSAVAPGVVVEHQLSPTAGHHGDGGRPVGVAVPPRAQQEPPAFPLPVRVQLPVDVAPAASSRRQGVYSGGYDPLLPYAVATPPRALDPPEATPLPALVDEAANRSGPLAVAVGMLLLAVSTHAQRLLRRRPEPSGPTSKGLA